MANGCFHLPFTIHYITCLSRLSFENRALYMLAESVVNARAGIRA
jgi:hypothetical protein